MNQHVPFNELQIIFVWFKLKSYFYLIDTFFHFIFFDSNNVSITQETDEERNWIYLESNEHRFCWSSDVIAAKEIKLKFLFNCTFRMVVDVPWEDKALFSLNVYSIIDLKDK